MTTPSTPLSPAACATELERLAQTHYDAAREHMARYERLKDDSTPEGHIARGNQLDKVPVEQEACRQLRFAATFLREHAVLRWTRVLPTVPGVHWWRVAGPRVLVNIWARSKDGVLMVAPYDDLKASVPLAEWDEDGVRWCGPIPPPEPEETPS